MAARPGPASALAVLALIVVGCLPTAETPAEPTPDVGGTWTAVSAAGKPAVPGFEPRFHFFLAEGEIRGETGCSDFEAPIEIRAGDIRVGDIGVSPGFGCPADVEDIEAVFVVGLRSAHRVEGRQGRLRLSGPGGDILLVRSDLVLDEHERALAQLLEAAPWRLTAATNLPSDPALPPVAFSGESFVATGGCGFSGRYRLRGADLIRLEGTSWEPDDCPPGLDRARADLVVVMESATSVAFDRSGQRLTLTGRDGVAEFELEAGAPQ